MKFIAILFVMLSLSLFAQKGGSSGNNDNLNGNNGSHNGGGCGGNPRFHWPENGCHYVPKFGCVMPPGTTPCPYMPVVADGPGNSKVCCYAEQGGHPGGPNSGGATEESQPKRR